MVCDKRDFSVVMLIITNIWVAENMVMNIFNTFEVVCKSSNMIHTACQFKGAILWFTINLSHIVEKKRKNTMTLKKIQTGYI